jgi:type VI secretion system protein ImpB
MATDSGARFIRRNRAPRVHISYEDPYDAERKIELPFVMGVMSDLSGNNAGSEKPDIADRKFLEFDMDNFDQRMKAINPGVSFKAQNKLGDGAGEKMSVNLRFEKMDDLSPAAVARQVPALAKLLQAREQLTNLMRYMDGKVAAEDQIKKLLGNPELMSAMRDRATEAEGKADADADAPPDAEPEEGGDGGKGKGKGKK